MKLEPACLALALSPLLVSSVAAQHSAPEQQLVEDFIEAYNRHDVDAMLTLAHPDVDWLSVSGDTITIQTAGAIALEQALRDYFASVPSTRSTIDAIMPAGRLVTVWERAHWQSNGSARSQSSLAVYEIEDSLIRRVWYYPVHP